MLTTLPPIPVYVPVPGSALAAHVLPRSGIVGEPEALRTARTGLRDGHHHVWFEGNRHRAENIVTFADCVDHAAGRMLTYYPTVAQSRVPERELDLVGHFDYPRGIVTCASPDAEALLAAWLGALDGAVPAEALVTSDGRGVEMERWRALRASPAQAPAHGMAQREIARREAQWATLLERAQQVRTPATPRPAR